MSDQNFDLFHVALDRESLRRITFFFQERLPSAIGRSQRYSLDELGEFIEREAFDMIATGGEGWVPRSNIANQYTTAPTQKNVVFRKKLSQLPGGFADKRAFNDSGMLFIMKYFRWRVENEGVNRDLFIDFAESSRDDVNFLITQVQTGAEITVTDKMRRAFSFTDFPLRKETRTIKIPAREIGKPLFRRSSPQYFTRFVDEFYPELLRQLTG